MDDSYINYSSRRTPVVETQRIQNVLGSPARIHVKLEYTSPSRSIMDRIALKIIEECERTQPDLMKRGTTLVTSGDPDFSIAVGSICAVKGLRTLAFVPTYTTEARRQTLKSLGVKVSLIPEVKSKNASKLFKALAANVCLSVPGSLNLNAFITNDLVDSIGTEIAGELQEQLHRPPHAIVGEKDGLGIFNAIARSLLFKLSEKTRCRMIQVEMDTPRFQQKFSRRGDLVVSDDIVGIETIQVTQKDAYRMTRKFISEEGIWCGPHGGMLLAGVIQSLQRRPLGDKACDATMEIVLLMNECLHSCDTAFLSNEWMVTKGFFTQIDISKMKWWDGISLSNLRLKSVPLIESSSKCQDVLRLLEESSSDTSGLGVIVDQSSLTAGAQCIKGIVDKEMLQESLKNGKISKADFIYPDHKKSDVLVHIKSEFGRISSDGNLGDLEKLLDFSELVVVYKSTFKVDAEGRLQEIHIPCGVATQIDILQWVSGVMDHHRMQSQWGLEAKTVFDEQSIP